MRMILTALVVWLSGASLVAAGAWLRDKDSLFMAATSTLRMSGEELLNETAVYAEYGLFPRATIGFDYNHLIGYSGHALAFLRLPVGPPDRELKMAIETAAGGHHWQGEWNPMLKATFSLGRGLKTRWGHGWLSLDAAVERRFGTPNPLFKLDATLGLPNFGRVGPMLQIETAKASGLPLFWTLTPSVRYDMKKLGTLVIGFESKHGPINTNGVKFGLWKQF